MPVAGLCSLALGSLQAGQESVNNLQALSDTGCNLPSRDGGWGYCGADSCNIAYTTCPGDNGGGPPTVDGVTGTWADGYSEDYCNDFYDLSAQTTVDPEPSLYCEGGATCVCSSSRRRLLFATVPNKGGGEATEECSCV